MPVLRKTKKEYLDIANRHYYIRKAGFTCQEMADLLGVGKAYFSMAVNASRAVPWLKTAIAIVVGRDYESFWGVEPPELTREDELKIYERLKGMDLGGPVMDEKNRGGGNGNGDTGDRG